MNISKKLFHSSVNPTEIQFDLKLTKKHLKPIHNQVKNQKKPNENRIDHITFCSLCA